MKLRIVLAVVALAILLSGCDPFGTTERAQIRLEEKREENRALAWQAEIFKAKTEETKAAWEGRAFFISILSTTGMPYYFGTMTIVISLLVFLWIGFPERFGKRRNDE
jgi:hypothetical protein